MTHLRRRPCFQVHRAGLKSLTSCVTSGLGCVGWKNPLGERLQRLMKEEALCRFIKMLEEDFGFQHVVHVSDLTLAPQLISAVLLVVQ